jgi:lipoprotein-anchoring transpeptidase ErfK/SrfK
VGQEISNGCIRVPNDVIVRIAQTVPVGTPVHIVV